MSDPTNEDIMRAVAEMRTDVCGHLHELTGRADGTDKVLATLTDQVNYLTEAKKTNSMRVEGLSDSDLTLKARLAEEIKAREKLAASNEVQLAILTRLDKVAANPQVKVVLAMLATAATTWLAMKGIK